MKASRWHLLLTLKSRDTFPNPELNFSLIIPVLSTASITHCKYLESCPMTRSLWRWGRHQTKLCFVLFGLFVLKHVPLTLGPGPSLITALGMGDLIRGPDTYITHFVGCGTVQPESRSSRIPLTMPAKRNKQKSSKGASLQVPHPKPEVCIPRLFARARSGPKPSLCTPLLRVFFPLIDGATD
jgi:hypothetical protein